MKILILSTMAGSSWGGSEVLWSKMAGELLDKGHQVVASVFDWGELPKQVIDLQKRGLIVHKRARINFDTIAGKIKGKIISKTLSRLELNKLKGIKPDFVFFSLGGAFDLTIPLYKDFAASLQVPFYCYLSLNTEYETLPLYKMQEQREVFNKARKIFFVSQRNKDTAQRQICSDLNNSIVINNPLTFSDLSSIEMPDTQIISFAMVARLDAMVKGHPVVLKILSDERWKHRNWKLNIYGVGPDEEYIKELIKYYKLTDKVVLKGQIKDIKNEIWALNHVLLMPSQYEGCPISLYDAAVCGRPAVVSDVGGNAEFTIENQNGYVSEAPSVKSFGNAMERFWDNNNRLKELGENAHQHAIAKLDTTPHLTVLKEILNTQ